MRQAFLVGIDNYITDPLTSCVKDASVVAGLLSIDKGRENGFDVDLLKTTPTLFELEEYLNDFFEKNSEISLFYFSGHAVQESDTKLILPDYSNHRQGLSFVKLLQMINSSKARHTIIILDCCYSGNIGDFFNSGNANTNIKPNVSILASSSSNEKSKSYKNGHSIFTYYLIEALEGGGADENGIINIASIYNYIEKSLVSKDQRPIFKCNIDQLVELKIINNLTALNYTSERIQEVIQSISNNKSIIKIVYQKEDYLKLLEEAINTAQEEILFTSSKISEIENEEYGDLQKKIINASRNFQIRNPKRKHLAIVPNIPDTHKGAIQLRKEVLDVVVRYHPSLKDNSYNFFISDNEKIIIRVKDNFNRINYALSIENKDLASLMKRHFYTLWKQSKAMHDRLLDYKKDAAFEFKLMGKEIFKSDANFIKFMDRLKSSDLNYKRISYNSIKEILSIESPTSLYSYNNESSFLKKFYSLIGNIYEKNNNLRYDSITLNKIQQIYWLIEQNEKINYKDYCYIFSFQFFLANYFKVKHSLYELKSKYFSDEKINSILDLGGGGGASIAGVIDFFGFGDTTSNLPSITLIDKSEEQIHIAQAILANYLLSVNINNSSADLYLRKEEKKFDLILSSNFLCELSSIERNAIFELVSNSLSINGYFLVIERVESNVYNDILSSQLFNLHEYKFLNERFQIPGYALDPIEEIFSSDKNLFEFVKKDYTLRYGLYTARSNRSI